jgi:hypothetical protein
MDKVHTDLKRKYSASLGKFCSRILGRSSLFLRKKLLSTNLQRLERYEATTNAHSPTWSLGESFSFYKHVYYQKKENYNGKDFWAGQTELSLAKVARSVSVSTSAISKIFQRGATRTKINSN